MAAYTGGYGRAGESIFREYMHDADEMSDWLMGLTIIRVPPAHHPGPNERKRLSELWWEALTKFPNPFDARAPVPLSAILPYRAAHLATFIILGEHFPGIDGNGLTDVAIEAGCLLIAAHLGCVLPGTLVDREILQKAPHDQELRELLKEARKEWWDYLNRVGTEVITPDDERFYELTSSKAHEALVNYYANWYVCCPNRLLANPLCQSVQPPGPIDCPLRIEIFQHI